MEFKQLEIKQEGSLIKRIFLSKHIRRSVLFILIGALLGLAGTYFMAGMEINSISSKDLLTNVFTGSFFGFFITNSPCARNKC